MLTRECHFHSSHLRNEHVVTVCKVKNVLSAQLYYRQETGACQHYSILKWPEHGHFRTLSGIKVLWEMESSMTAHIRKLDGDESWILSFDRL